MSNFIKNNGVIFLDGGYTFLNLKKHYSPPRDSYANEVFGFVALIPPCRKFGYSDGDEWMRQ